MFVRQLGTRPRPLVDGVEIVKTSHFPRAVVSDVRIIERVLRRVDGRLGAA